MEKIFGLGIYTFMTAVALYCAVMLVREFMFYGRNGWDFSVVRAPANRFQNRLHDRFPFLKIGQVRVLYYLSNFIMGMAWTVGAREGFWRSMSALLTLSNF